MRRLDLMSATNVVHTPPDTALRGRVGVHISSVRGMRRKRVQPRGSKQCHGECGRPISVNANLCLACQTKRDEVNG